MLCWLAQCACTYANECVLRVAGDRPAPGGRVVVDRRPDPVRESEERPLHDGGPHNEEDDDYHQEM